MRVMIAAVACLAALVRADAASAADGTGRPITGSVCGEPSRLAPPPVISDAPSVVAEGAGELAAAPQFGEDATTLWCVSPDDPRCAPLENSAPSAVSFASAKLGCAFDPSLAVPPFATEAVADGGAEYVGSARDGVLGRLERPPR